MCDIEPKAFVDGTDPQIAKAIQGFNRLKLSKYISFGDIITDAGTSTPYFANLYWLAQHEYDMDREYADEGSDWIPQMTQANWQSVRKWLGDYKDVFAESAQRYDQSIIGTDKTSFGIGNWTEKAIDGKIC